MDFTQWLKANGYDEAALTPTMRKHLEAAWQAEVRAANPPPSLPQNGPAAPFADEMARVTAESARISHIQKTTLRYCNLNLGNEEKIASLKRLSEAAIADRNMSAKDFDIAMLHADRSIGMMVITPKAEEASADVIEAAICMTHKVKGVEKQYNERTLEAAHKRFRNGITLCGLVSMFARDAGYRGDLGGEGNLKAMLRTIKFAQQRPNAYEAMASSGLSSISISGILSNVANKSLVAQFLYGEQSYRSISKIRTANDFKQMTTYRMTGSNKFIKIPPGGEIKHGTLSDLTYTNQVDTYGIMLGIDRRDFINDDLGALMGRGAEVGQGAIDGINEVFWTEWLDDSAFFPTDKSLLNYDDGATDSVLSLAGLDNAENLFASQTKPNGTPLGATPRILLVPRALRNTALNLMAPSVTAAAQSTATQTLANVYAGRYDVVDSIYLQSSAISGYSSTAWYLLADPNNLAAIEVAFLFGRDTPIIEEAELDFDRLGVSMRAYWDFGVNKQEYRAAVKLKGAA